MRTVYYFYPMRHRVSFQFVARQYIEMLRERYSVEEIDEVSFYGRDIFVKPRAFVHPYLYIAGKRPERAVWETSRYDKLVAVDVADSDRLSREAANLFNLADACLVPSTWSREAYIRSGVAVPVHVVPHALKPIFYEPRVGVRESPSLAEHVDLLLKVRERYRALICFFLWHSFWRKGGDLVLKTLSALRRERGDFAVIARTADSLFLAGLETAQVPAVSLTQWLDDKAVVAVYDLCDIYPLFSRGGGFELNGLEALARGEVVLAASEGSWTDYLPPEFLLPVAKYEHPLPRNPYHVGLGPVVDTEKAVDKLHIIIDNLDDWRARARERAMQVRERFSAESVKNILLNACDRIGI
jgi:glycosyltransferase involved in cell wall biosynthesis